MRAVFITRFISHSVFSRIVKDARKRGITLFNPEGTGKITKQIKELLNLTPQQKVETTEMTPPKGEERSKLDALIPFINWEMGKAQNAREILMPKAQELGIQTTLGSLTQLGVYTGQEAWHQDESW